MLGRDYCLNSGQERMDLMKSWAGIEEEKAGRSVCCVMQSVRVLVMCCGDCPAFVSIRSAFMLELRRELGDRFEHFQSLDSFEKSSYVLGSEAWEEYSSGLLGLIKDYVLSVWEERKVRLYGEHANVHQSHSQNDSGDLRGVAGGDGELGCLCGKAGTSHLCDGSTHSSGCVVNGYGCRLSYYFFFFNVRRLGATGYPPRLFTSGSAIVRYSQPPRSIYPVPPRR